VYLVHAKKWELDKLLEESNGAFTQEKAKEMGIET
jgi:hypothetical protein